MINDNTSSVLINSLYSAARCTGASYFTRVNRHSAAAYCVSVNAYNAISQIIQQSMSETNNFFYSLENSLRYGKELKCTASSEHTPSQTITSAIYCKSINQISKASRILGDNVNTLSLITNYIGYYKFAYHMPNFIQMQLDGMFTKASVSSIIFADSMAQMAISVTSGIGSLYEMFSFAIPEPQALINAVNNSNICLPGDEFLKA